MMMFDDKVGGWEWLNDDVIKKYTRKKKLLFACAENKVVFFLKKNFFYAVTFYEPELLCSM